MEFIQLNHDWNAEPNAPNVCIKIIGKDVSVSFYLNYQMYHQFNKGDIGVLTFHNSLQYRIGSPNDEGFYCYGQSRYKQFGVEWGEFYLVEHSDWRENFPDLVRVSKTQETGMNHFLFYFRDETFECIAGAYDFLIKPIK